MQSVSLDLLSPTPLYYNDGSVSDKLYLFYAGDIEYCGKEHLPFAILALLLLVVFMLLPVLLLFLYPCTCFQQFLNRVNCNFTKLKIMMDVFQGNYKDRTDNNRDYRFFSGIFFITLWQMHSCSILYFSLFCLVLQLPCWDFQLLFFIHRAQKSTTYLTVLFSLFSLLWSLL